MGHTAVAGRCHVYLARICFGISDEFRNGFSRDRWIDHHNFGHAQNACYWRDIADEIKIEVVVERRVDCGRRGDQEERITVCGRVHDEFCGDIAAGARPVLDDKLLPEAL